MNKSITPTRVEGTIDRSGSRMVYAAALLVGASAGGCRRRGFALLSALLTAVEPLP
jgi:hypothetical protein